MPLPLTCSLQNRLSDAAGGGFGQVYEPLPDGAPALDCLQRYRGAFQSLAARSSTALDEFTKLAAEQPDDGLIAFHLDRLQRGETGIEIVMNEK